MAMKGWPIATGRVSDQRPVIGGCMSRTKAAGESGSLVIADTCPVETGVSDAHRSALVKEAWVLLGERVGGEPAGRDDLLSALCLTLLETAPRIDLDRLPHVCGSDPKADESPTGHARSPIAHAAGVRDALRRSSVECVEGLTGWLTADDGVIVGAAESLSNRSYKRHAFNTILRPFRDLIDRAASAVVRHSSRRTIMLKSHYVQSPPFVRLEYVNAGARGRAAKHGRGNPASGSTFFDDFMAKEEHRPEFTDGVATIVGHRGYRFLLHMFACQAFPRYRALDLTFRRWEELAAAGGPVQTLNVSEGIFANIGTLLEDGRCMDFRRILVVTEEQLALPFARPVLEQIRAREANWCERFGTDVVRTRVLLYPSRGLKTDLINKIRDCQDFAMFLGGKENLALVEVGMTNPNNTSDVSTAVFHLNKNNAALRSREAYFDEFWDRHAVPLEGVTVTHPGER